MTTWLDETRFEDPNKLPQKLEYDPETWKVINEVLGKLEEKFKLSKIPNTQDWENEPLWY